MRLKRYVISEVGNIGLVEKVNNAAAAAAVREKSRCRRRSCPGKGSVDTDGKKLAANKTVKLIP